MFLRYLIVGLLLSVPLGCFASDNAEPPGFLEGHLKILSLKEVQLAGENGAKEVGKGYGDYPLVILSRDTHKEVERVTAGSNGNYRLALPPGGYTLDVQDRARKHVRAKPRPFVIVSNETVHVNMEMDTGIR